MPASPPPNQKQGVQGTNVSLVPKKERSFKDLDPNDPRAKQIRKAVTITTSQGVIKIDDLDMPEDVKDLLESLDFDGAGNVHQAEFEAVGKLLKGLRKHIDCADAATLKASMALVVRLVESKKLNSTTMEYGHLPENIQKVFRLWDLDNSGSVDSSELNGAANAWTKMQEEGKIMKRLLSAAVFVLILMFAGMFVIGLVTADLSKEFKKSEGGPIVESRAGFTIQTANSDTMASTDGSLRIRNGVYPVANATADGTARVAQALKTGKLSSTLPDSTFSELRMVTLFAKNGATLQLRVQSFDRLGLRSSLCGSVVKVTTTNGVLTLDNSNADADDKLLAYAESSGMGHVFRNGSPLGNGRRLESDDGSLQGSFNILDSAHLECRPQPIKSPETMSQNYLAQIQVKEAVFEQDATGNSQYFVNRENKPLKIAGMLRENGRLLKSYDATMLRSGSTSAHLKRYVMAPHTRFLTIRQNQNEMSMATEVGTGYNCLIGQAPEGALGSASYTEETMQFMGVVEEAGIVARRFRMHLGKQSLKLRRLALQNGGYLGGRRLNDDDETKAQVLSSSGQVPNYMDYYDVDSDESGVRQPGDPYRVVFGSTVPGSFVYTETRYLSVKPLTTLLGTVGILEHLGIEDIQNTGTANCPCRLEKGASPTNTDFCSAAAKYPAKGDKVAPPPMLPYTELVPNLVSSYDKLLAEQRHHLTNPSQPQPPSLSFALGTQFWRGMLNIGFNHEKIMDLKAQTLPPVPAPASTPPPTLDANRRLSSNNWQVVAKDDFHCTVTGTSTESSVSVSAGVASLETKVTYGSSGKVKSLKASASGSAIVWDAPESKFSLSGSSDLDSGVLKIAAEININYGLSFSIGVEAGSVASAGCLTEIYGKTNTDLLAVNGWMKLALKPRLECKYQSWHFEVLFGYTATVFGSVWESTYTISGQDFWVEGSR